MANKAAASILMLGFLFSAISLPLFVTLANAQFVPGGVIDDSPPTVSVSSPVNGTKFYSNSVSLNLTVSWGNSEDLYAVGYVLDGASFGPFATNNGSAPPLEHSHNFSLNLTLIPGVHNVQAYANVTGYKVSAINYPQLEPITVAAGWSDTVIFTTASSPTPNVPEFPWLIILPMFLSILSITVILRLKNKENRSISHHG